MHVTNSKPPEKQFGAIKDHADLLNFLERLCELVFKREAYGWKVDDEIAYGKAEIAHFLRIQSAQPGVYVEGDKSAISSFASYRPPK